MIQRNTHRNTHPVNDVIRTLITLKLQPSVVICPNKHIIVITSNLQCIVHSTLDKSISF